MSELTIFLCGLAAGAGLTWVWGVVTVRAILVPGQDVTLRLWVKGTPPPAGPDPDAAPEGPDYDDPDWWKRGKS